MGSEERSEYSVFLEKVKRTVYVDNLSPQVTLPVLRTAFDQFGSVKSVQFIPNYLGPRNMPQAALVEMESEEKAKAVITTLTEFPFMICGMPRPVRVLAAVPEMFDDRPIGFVRKIQCRWVDPSDPDFEVANKLKELVDRHSAEASFLLKEQLEEEEKLAKQQAEMLRAHYQKYAMIEDLLVDKTAQRLGHHYNMSSLDDH